MLLVKQLQKQELGWSGDTPGQRGAYFLICKDWHRWFPPLSDTQENDCAPIRLSLSDGNEVVLPYVWHNSRIFRTQANGRDESRLYISGLKAMGADPQPGDLAVLRPQLADAKPTDQFELSIAKRGSPEHAKLLQHRGGSGNYWIVDQLSDATLSFETTIATGATAGSMQEIFPTGAPDEQVEVSSDLSRFLASTPDEVMSSRISDPTFRAIVLSAYENKCAISGQVIFAGKHLNLEAAHIRPQSHAGLNLPSNGIALCRDLHWAFDKGAFTLDDTGRIDVHPDARRDTLASIHGKRPFTPSDAFYAPRQSFAQYHREHVYGLFKRSGTLAMPSDL